MSASARQIRFRNAQASEGKKQVTVYLSEDARRLLELLKVRMGAGSLSETLERFVTSNAQKYAQAVDLEEGFEGMVERVVSSEGSLRAAARKLNEDGIPSVLPRVSWSHRQVARVLNRVGMRD